MCIRAGVCKADVSICNIDLFLKLLPLSVFDNNSLLLFILYFLNTFFYIEETHFKKFRKARVYAGLRRFYRTLFKCTKNMI